MRNVCHALFWLGLITKLGDILKIFYANIYLFQSSMYLFCHGSLFLFLKKTDRQEMISPFETTWSWNGCKFFLPLEISIKFFEFNIVLRRIIYPLFSNICHNTMMAMMDVSMHKQTETNQTQLWYQSPCTSNKQLPITWRKPKWDGILIHFLISHLLLILPSETAARQPVWLLWITIKSIIVGTRLLKGCPQFK